MFSKRKQKKAEAAAAASEKPEMTRTNSDFSPFDDMNATTTGQNTPARHSNPFSPAASRPESIGASSALRLPGSNRYFHSRRIRKGEIEKPWLSRKDPKEKWVTIIPIIGLVLGLLAAAALVYDGLRSVVNHTYQLVLDENFASGSLDPKIWTREVEAGGFGNGQFDLTTNNDENAFVKDGQLHIKATLQDPALISKDGQYNLINGTSQWGKCTSAELKNCIMATNTTVGNATIVNPVKSARLNTKLGASIAFGRVEVTAKLPIGDWLWPAIWMMPVKETYGIWPQSGEIDIMESRGNNYSYPQGGNNIMSSALHWGPNQANDAWWRSNVKRQALHTTYAKSFNTFGLEWSQKYLFTYVNSRLLQVMYQPFDQPLWAKGNFPLSDSNGSRIVDPWSQTGNASTPFDQPFYLILNLAVGGTNGWFEDGVHGKPWVDGSPSARKDFWSAQQTWLKSWDQPEMVISKIQMWQQVGN